MTSRSFQDLMVWQKAHEFVVETYRVTRAFPREELFGLTSQLRRAAVSIPANIAEGFVRRGLADKARFYNIAAGSLEECRYYLILAASLGYADTKTGKDALDEVSRMLESYTAAVRSKIRTTALGLAVAALSLGAGLVTTGYWLLATGY